MTRSQPVRAYDLKKNKNTLCCLRAGSSVDITIVPPSTLFLAWSKKIFFFSSQRLESNFTVSCYLFEEQMNFPCKPPCSLFSNRCLSVCIASWVINPGFRSTKFGCSRFLSTLSWDPSTRTHH